MPACKAVCMCVNWNCVLVLVYMHACVCVCESTCVHVCVLVNSCVIKMTITIIYLLSLDSILVVHAQRSGDTSDIHSIIVSGPLPILSRKKMLVHNLFIYLVL